MFIIAFVGPEGSGKTHHTKYFANLFETDYAMEYGFWYCQNVLEGYFINNRFLTTKKDFNKIVLEQKKIWQEKMITSEKKILFFDTDLIFTKYFIDKQFMNWTWIDYEINKQPIDLYIFLKPKEIHFQDYHLINPKNAHWETERLLNIYKKFVSEKLIVVDEKDNWEDQVKLIKNIIDKYNCFYDEKN